MIERGYRLWNTVNTTTDIYLLVENGNKNTETKSLLLTSVLKQLIVVLLVYFSFFHFSVTILALNFDWEVPRYLN